MPSDDVGEGLDMLFNTGELKTRQESLALRSADFCLGPIPRIGEILPHFRQLLKLLPGGPHHGVTEKLPFIRRPKVLDDKQRALPE